MDLIVGEEYEFLSKDGWCPATYRGIRLVPGSTTVYGHYFEGYETNTFVLFDGPGTIIRQIEFEKAVQRKFVRRKSALDKHQAQLADIWSKIKGKTDARSAY